MISFGAIYHMLPILWKREKMYSVELVNVHFWLATVGIVLYITSMWTAGITQGLMWRSYDSMGFLKYSFLQSVIALHPYYVIRAIGGIFFLSGALVLVYNALCTIERIQKQVYNQPVSLAS
ncbi:MAG: cytochrome-c oxidase [Candidatus Midichloria mitochondrii]